MLKCTVIKSVMSVSALSSLLQLLFALTTTIATNTDTNTFLSATVGAVAIL